MGTRMIPFYNNLKIHKLNYAEGPLATSAIGLSTVSSKKLIIVKESKVKYINVSTVE